MRAGVRRMKTRKFAAQEKNFAVKLTRLDVRVPTRGREHFDFEPKCVSVGWK